MKRTIISLAVLIIACSLCSLVAYRAGARRVNEAPREVAKKLPTRVFFNLMAGLEQLRAGRIESGTRRVEAVCFASGAIVYSDPVSREDRLIRFCTPDLVRYRATYCTNSAKWSVEEKQLETLLADRK